MKAKTAGFRWLPSYYEAVRNLPDSDRLRVTESRKAGDKL